MKTRPSVAPPDHSIEGHVPRDADKDHRHEDRAGDGKIPPPQRWFEAGQDRTDLQADEDKGQHVQHEDRRLPDRVRRDANARRDSFGRRPRHRHGVAHHGQHTGQSNPVRQDPDAERADELKDDRRRHVPDTVGPAKREPSEHRTDDDTARHGEHERGCHRRDGKGVDGDRADREAVDQQRAGVVQQALAFENRQDALGRPQLSQHGGGRRGVGWRDDGAERYGRGPWHGRHQRTGHRRDSDGGQADSHHDQAGDREPVVPEVPRRCIVRRVEQDGGHEKRQCQLGQHGKRRRTGNECEEGAADGKKHRIRRADAPRRGGQQRRGEEEADENFQLSHITAPTVILADRAMREDRRMRLAAVPPQRRNNRSRFRRTAPSIHAGRRARRRGMLPGLGTRC